MHLTETDRLKIFVEEVAKLVKKKKKKMRPANGDKGIARQIGAVMKSKASEIGRLLPRYWDLSGPLILDKKHIEKRGSAYMYGTIRTEYDYPISAEGDMEARAEIIIECYSYDSGEGVVCGVSVSDFDPCWMRDEGVVMTPKYDGMVMVEVEWSKDKKDFDPQKNVFPLIQSAMKKLRSAMPEYEEFYKE